MAVTQDEERCIGHYSTSQQILLVGEGDFSFSNALANAFGSASNLVATSLDSYDETTKKFTSVHVTLGNLLKLGAVVLHGIDATTMATHRLLGQLSFDRIVFNFPHSGVSGNESFSPKQEQQKHVIREHKELVLLFFQNAAKLLRANGEVHVSHMVNHPYCEWKLEKQAAKNGLVLTDSCHFDLHQYPGYVNRRGIGIHCARTFRVGPFKTFRFVIDPVNVGPQRLISLTASSYVNERYVRNRDEPGFHDATGGMVAPISLKRPYQSLEIDEGDKLDIAIRFLTKLNNIPSSSPGTFTRVPMIQEGLLPEAGRNTPKYWVQEANV
eukprot:c38962_g1_i1 orf=434-1408(-)